MLYRLAAVLCLSVCALMSFASHAAVLTPDLEIHLIPNVSTSWQTVGLSNTYTSAIPFCTYNLISFSGTNPNYDFPPAVVRIRNITATSFDVRIQGWEDAAAVAGDVHCLITDSGAHILPDGRRYEAHTVLSDRTSGRSSTDGGWNQANLENVSGSLVNTYTNHVVLGQVISFQDNRASVFHATDCENRANEPFLSGHTDGICVGKHIGRIAGTRNTETVGYLVAEAGTGTINNVPYALARGADSVGGNNNANSGFTYSVTGDWHTGVLTQAGEDGGDGSWSVLYGADPLPANQIKLAVDEEAFAGDFSRNHTLEKVYYWVFGVAGLTLQKTVVNDNGGTAAASDFNLDATGPESIAGVTGQAEITEVTVLPGDYDLSETGPTGYTGTWSCTGAVLTGTTVVIDNGAEVICTLTNDDNFVVQQAFLTLQKLLINDNGGTASVGDFELTFDNGSGDTGTGVHGSSPVTAAAVAPGLYKLTESVVQGYSLTQINCAGGADTDGLDGVELAVGENVTCTFVNDDRGVDLSVTKSVGNDAPNVGEVVTFTISVTNNGPDTATDFHVVDTIQPGFSYLVGSIAGGDVMDDSSPSGTGLDWVVNSLASGDTVDLTFQATVQAP